MVVGGGGGGRGLVVGGQWRSRRKGAWRMTGTPFHILKRRISITHLSPSRKPSTLSVVSIASQHHLWTY